METFKIHGIHKNVNLHIRKDGASTETGCKRDAETLVKALERCMPSTTMGEFIKIWLERYPSSSYLPKKFQK